MPLICIPISSPLQILDQTYLRNQNLITRLHTDTYSLAVLVKSSRSDCQYFCFVEFLDGGFGEEDAAGGFGFGFDALDEDAVEEWGEGFD